MSDAPAFTLRLAGPVRLTDPAGRDFTPTKRKVCALLVLLATAPGRRRARAWLQDKLWSESEPELGAASLRQTLLELRRALGDGRDLVAGRGGWLWLEETRILVEDAPTPDLCAGPGEPPEFCEGLDVDDPEFEDWIRDQRLVWADRVEALRRVPRPAPAAAPAAPAPPRDDRRPILALAPAEGDSELLRTVGDMLAAEAGQKIAQIGGAELRMEPPVVEPRGGRALRLGLRLFRLDPAVMAQAYLRDLRTGEMAWSAQRPLNLAAATRPQDGPWRRFAADIADAAAFAFGRLDATRESGPPAAAYAALRLAGLYEGPAMQSADKLLAEAHADYGAPVLLAQRGLLRVWSILERTVEDAGLAREEAREMIRRALEQDGVNPTVLTVAAEFADIDDRPDFAAELTERAHALEPANPFVMAGRAKAMVRRGDAARAHAMALAARRAAMGQPNHAWWTMLCSVTALRCGRFDEARRFAEAAHDLAPGFRPPLRFLIGLRFHAGDEAGAIAAAEKLRLIEPDFSLKLMNDASYPLRSFRDTPLLTVARSRLV